MVQAARRRGKQLGKLCRRRTSCAEQRTLPLRSHTTSGPLARRARYQAQPASRTMCICQSQLLRGSPSRKKTLGYGDTAVIIAFDAPPTATPRTAKIGRASCAYQCLRTAVPGAERSKSVVCNINSLAKAVFLEAYGSSCLEVVEPWLLRMSVLGGACQ